MIDNNRGRNNSISSIYSSSSRVLGGARVREIHMVKNLAASASWGPGALTISRGCIQ